MLGMAISVAEVRFRHGFGIEPVLQVFALRPPGSFVKLVRQSRNFFVISQWDW